MSSFDTLDADNDAPTVTARGESLATQIDGVITRDVVTHVDHRGRLFEVFNGHDSEFWAAPIVHSYVFTLRTNTIKGWGVHQKKADRYCLIHGETMTVLYDARPDSPTYQLVQEVPLSNQGIQQLLIPAGVWHLSVNLAPHETLLINFPTEAYHYESPDRLTLPWNTDKIPVDARKYFPRQMLGARGV